MAQIAGWVAGQAKKVASFAAYTEIYLQVAGAAVFYVGRTKQELETPSAIPAGLQFTQANTNPPYKLTWIGDLWIAANEANSVIEVTPTIPPQGQTLSGGS